MHAQDQNFKIFYIIDKSNDFFVSDIAFFEMRTTHLEHIVNRQILALDDLFGVLEAPVLLVELAEFTRAALFAPELVGRGVHHSVLVIDGHAVGTVRGQRIDHEGPWRHGEHLVANIYIGAERVPARGVVKDVLVVALDAEISSGPALVTDTHHPRRLTGFFDFAQSV